MNGGFQCEIQKMCADAQAILLVSAQARNLGDPKLLKDPLFAVNGASLPFAAHSHPEH